MTLEDLTRVIEFQSASGGGRNLEEQTDADRKIRSVEEAGLGREDHLAQARYLVIPAGSSNHQICLCSDTGLGIGQRGGGSGEIDHRVGPGERVGSERAAAGIVSRR